MPWPRIVPDQWSLRTGSGFPRKVGRVILAISLATVGGAMFAPTAADAAFPGANGLIVFASSKVGSVRWCHARDQGNQLFEVQPGETDAVQLTCTPGSDLHPFVSPDGSEVVFSNVVRGGPSRLFTLPLPSTPPSRPARPDTRFRYPGASDDYPSWSPTGDGSIVFQRTAPGAPSQLYIEDVSHPSSASPVFPSPTGFNDSEPVFDPSDPEVVTFVRRVGHHTHIFSYDLKSQVLVDLSAQDDGGTSGNDFKPDYAPTGAGGRIVFQSDRQCSHTQLYTMTTQGTDQVPVFPPTRRHFRVSSPRCGGASADPVYSPQGDDLAYDGQTNGGGTELLTVPVNASGAATGNPTGTTNHCALSEEPNWGPAADPPAQTPEVGLPVFLPVLGAGIILGSLGIYRRRRDRLSAGSRRRGPDNDIS